MSIIVPARRDRSRAAAAAVSQSFFDTPQKAGRKITAGFTYLQRIGKSGTYDVWFPPELKRELEAKRDICAADFASEWAAVRQFELLHESGNHKIYDLDPQLIMRALRDISRSMRAGGYRVTVVTLGRYEDPSATDELEILDQRLQEHISTMIHMLYLEEMSGEINSENKGRLSARLWDYRQDLPHIGMVLGAETLFSREKNAPKRRKLARAFFDIVNALPQNHIVHDTAVGLQLPELIGENQWNYIADPEETLDAFNRVLNDLFDKFNGISLSKLNGHADATDEIKAAALHLRGYGDRLSESGDSFLRQASMALAFG